MMSKADAADFLRKLAQSTAGDSTQPRVIVVRSSRETKTFVASALEQLELAGNALQSGASSQTTGQLSACFESIAFRASEHGLHQLTDAVCYAETLATLATLAGTAEKEPLTAAFSAILKYLSAAMLRVYVDGGDQNCGEELGVIRRIVVESSPKTDFVVAQKGNSSRLLN